MTGQSNPVVFLDGYAGRGEYEDGEPGSPLLLTRCAEFVSGFRDVRGFFVEQDDDNFANLRQVLHAKGGTVRRELRHGTLDEHLPELLVLAKDASLFAFLDPFGPALAFDTIRHHLLGRPGHPPRSCCTSASRRWPGWDARSTWRGPDPGPVRCGQKDRPPARPLPRCRLVAGTFRHGGRRAHGRAGHRRRAPGGLRVRTPADRGNALPGDPDAGTQAT
ncbi:three-Cys-motif partner protein TcmP [Micromonospora zhanjiangensis]